MVWLCVTRGGDCCRLDVQLAASRGDTSVAAAINRNSRAVHHGKVDRSPTVDSDDEKEGVPAADNATEARTPARQNKSHSESRARLSSPLTAETHQHTSLYEPHDSDSDDSDTATPVLAARGRAAATPRAASQSNSPVQDQGSTAQPSYQSNNAPSATSTQSTHAATPPRTLSQEVQAATSLQSNLIAASYAPHLPILFDCT